MSNCWYRWTKFIEPLQLWLWNFAKIHTQLLRFFRKRTFQQVWKRILILGQKFDPSSNRLKSLIEGHLRLPKQECISKAFFFSTCFHPKANFWKNFQHNLQCLKITQNVTFEFFNFGIFHQFFVLLKLTCLVTLFNLKLQVFKKSPKWTIFVHSKSKGSSLCSQCWMRLFLWFSNTVAYPVGYLLFGGPEDGRMEKEMVDQSWKFVCSGHLKVNEILTGRCCKEKGENFSYWPREEAFQSRILKLIRNDMIDEH